MNPARITPCAMGFWKASTTSTPKTAAAMAARFTALRIVGCRFIRSSRRWRAICLASWRV
jgi:hypothetical protein